GPKEGRGVNTVVLGGKEGLVMRKNELGNIAFLLVPTLVPLEGAGVALDLARLFKASTENDDFKKAVLISNKATPADKLEEIAQIGYAIAPYHPSKPFGTVPKDRVVYRADNLAAFAIGRLIGWTFLDALVPGGGKKAQDKLQDMLLERDKD